MSRFSTSRRPFKRDCSQEPAHSPIETIPAHRIDRGRAMVTSPPNGGRIVSEGRPGAGRVICLGFGREQAQPSGPKDTQAGGAGLPACVQSAQRARPKAWNRLPPPWRRRSHPGPRRQPRGGRFASSRCFSRRRRAAAWPAGAMWGNHAKGSLIGIEMQGQDRSRRTARPGPRSEHAGGEPLQMRPEVGLEPIARALVSRFSRVARVPARLGREPSFPVDRRGRRQSPSK